MDNMQTAESHNSQLTGRVEFIGKSHPVTPKPGTLNLAECESALREIRSRAGYSIFDAVVKKLNRERVNPERQQRKRFPTSVYQRLYDKQGGDCRECGDRLFVPARKNEIDHIDPNREDFNHPSNLQLLHPKCNREKSSKSVYEQSKASGRSFEEIIGEDP